MDTFKDIEEYKTEKKNINKFENNKIDEEQLIKKNYLQECQDFIEENRNTFFWIIVVFGIILIINEYNDNTELLIQNGGKKINNMLSKIKSGSKKAGEKIKSGSKKAAIKGLGPSTRTGRSADVADQQTGAFGAANYLLSFKYQISALIQMVAITVFLIIVVMPPLSLLIIAVLSFILLKPNLKSLFRL